MRCLVYAPLCKFFCFTLPQAWEALILMQALSVSVKFWKILVCFSNWSYICVAQHWAAERSLYPNPFWGVLCVYPKPGCAKDWCNASWCWGMTRLELKNHEYFELGFGSNCHTPTLLKIPVLSQSSASFFWPWGGKKPDHYFRCPQQFFPL